MVHSALAFFRKEKTMLAAGWLAAAAILIIFVLGQKALLRHPFLSSLSGFDADYFIYTWVITPGLFIACVTAFWAIGKAFLRIFSLQDAGQRLNALFSIAAGMGVCNLLFMGLGAFGLLYPGPVIGVLVLGGLGAVLHLRDLQKKGKKSFSLELPGGPWFPPMAALLALAAVNGVCGALAPATNWDALVYHLPLAEFYSKNHRIFAIPWMFEKQCTIGMEMLSASAFALGNDLLPPLFTLLAEALLIGAAAWFAAKNFSKSVAGISMALFAVMPVAMDVGSTANNDLAVALFSVLSVLCLWEYARGGGDRWLWGIAVFSAFSVDAKLSGLITFCWAILVIAVLHLRGMVRIRRVTLIPALAVFAAIVSPIFIRNWLWTGNPLFPFLHRVFGASAAETTFLAKAAVFSHAYLGVERTPLNFLLLPYHLIAHYWRFQNTPQYFVIGALPLVLWRLTRRKYTAVELFLLSYAGFFVTVWFFSDQQIWRYLLPVLPFAAMLLVSWLRSVKQTSLRLVLALCLAVNAVPLLSRNISDQLLAVSALPRSDMPARTYYLFSRLNQYPSYVFINAFLPKNSRILLFQELRGYYLERPYIWGDPLNQSVIVYEDFATPEDLRDRLKSLGVTHVLINRVLLPPSKYEHYYDDRTIRLMDSVTSAYGKRLFGLQGVDVYVLDYDRQPDRSIVFGPEK